MKYDILLFDLIGVLVEDSDQTTQTVIEASGMSEQELWDFWVESPAVREFDSGRISSMDFGERMVRELNLRITAQEFIDYFRVWVGGLYRGTEQLLSELKGKYRLGCFSNNNEIMWPQIRDEHGMGDLLDDYFLSHEIGMLKPDIAAFEYVVNELDLPANRIAFFDDLDINVEAAKQLGIDAYVTKGLPELRERLEKLQLM